jgi:putative solute:sodium symporter small subunit
MTDDPARRGEEARRSVTDEEARSHHQAYWRTNVRYVGLLLVVWFVVSYGFGIIFVDALNQFRIPGTGFPLGFWFAQQGSIYVFVGLIFVYVVLMNRLDRAYGLHEDDDR